MKPIAAMHQTETADVLHSQEFHAHSWGRVDQVAAPGNVRVLAHDLNVQADMDCFYTRVTKLNGVLKIGVGPGIVHNTLVEPKEFDLSNQAKTVYLVIRAEWATSSYLDGLGVTVIYRLPGPKSVVAALEARTASEGVPDFDDQPGFLQTFREVAKVRRAVTAAEQLTAVDGWYVEPGEDATNGIFPLCVSPI